MAKRKLGRGLDILIGRGKERGASSDKKPAVQTTANGGGAGQEKAESSGPAGEKTGLDIRQVNPRDVDVNPQQPRKSFPADELEALKNSISREGVLQPILVRRSGGKFQVIAGERRFRAAQELGLDAIPAVVVDVPEDRLLELALIENIHRANLNPIELAEAYVHLVDRNGWTQETLAEKLGVSRSGVTNTLRLLDLPQDMQDALIRGQVTTGHAKVLLSVSDDAERRRLFDRIAEENLTVRDLEDVRELESGEADSARKGRKRPRGRGSRKKPYIVSLEEELSERLGARVRITERKNGRGVLSIEFYSKEDFERLRALFSG